jgi:hypothetical protein
MYSILDSLFHVTSKYSEILYCNRGTTISISLIMRAIVYSTKHKYNGASMSQWSSTSAQVRNNENSEHENKSGKRKQVPIMTRKEEKKLKTAKNLTNLGWGRWMVTAVSIIGRQGAGIFYISVSVTSRWGWRDRHRFMILVSERRALVVVAI